MIGSENSIVRKGISHAFKLVDLGVKLSAPAAVSEVTSIALERMREYVEGRRAARFEEFHKVLLNRSENATALDEAEIDAADYHALLNACLADIEDEKTGAFAILTRSIALGRVPAEHRRHFILSLRDISFDQLDLVRKLYVITKNRIQPSRGAGQLMVKAVLQHANAGTVAHLNYEALRSRGYVEPENLTGLGIKFVEACSNLELLEPGAYGYRIWSGYRCMLISGLLDSPRELSIINAVTDSLRRNLVETGPTLLRGGINERLSDSPIAENCCVLLTDLERDLAEEQYNILRKLAEKVPVVQVCLGSGLITNPVGRPLAIHGDTPTNHDLEKLISEIRSAVSNFQ